MKFAKSLKVSIYYLGNTKQGEMREGIFAAIRSLLLIEICTFLQNIAFNWLSKYM